MRTRRYRIHLIAALVVALGGFGAIVATGTAPRLGLDLEGGISVTLTATGEVNSEVLQKTVEIIRERIDSLGVAEPEVTAAGTNNILIQLPGIKDDQRALEVIGTTAQLTFRQVLEQIPATAPDKQRPEVTKGAGTEVNDQEVVYPDAQGGSNAPLYRLAPATLTGDVVTKAQAVVDPTSGQWSVSLDMDSEGADRWASFTSRLACLRDKGEQVKSQVAIVLDGKVESAAGMQDPASSGGSGESYAATASPGARRRSTPPVSRRPRISPSCSRPAPCRSPWSNRRWSRCPRRWDRTRWTRACGPGSWAWRWWSSTCCSTTGDWGSWCGWA